MAQLATFIAEKAGFAIAGKAAEALNIDLSSLGIGDSAELRQIQMIQKDIKQIIRQQEALKVQLDDFEKSVNVQFSAGIIRPPALGIMAFAAELDRVLGNFGAQTATSKIGDFQAFKDLQTQVRAHCGNYLFLYTAGCIESSDESQSYIYNIVELFHSKHIKGGDFNYGLQRLVTDLHHVLLRMSHIQHVAKLLLCYFVATSDHERQGYADDEKKNLIKQAETLQGFMPPGISLDDEYGDRDLIALGSASDPNGAWQLVDAGNAKQFLSSHSWVETHSVGLGDNTRDFPAHWVPYVRTTDVTEPAHLRWSFWRQESGLYKVWNPAANSYIRFSKDCEEVYKHAHNSSFDWMRVLGSNTNHSTYHVNSDWGHVVLFKLIVLKPTAKNPHAWHIRLVDTYYGSTPDDVPRLFAGWGEEEWATFRLVNAK